MLNDAQALVAHGDDPAEAKKAQAALADAYLANKERDGIKPVTIRKNRWLLNMAVADFGDMSVTLVKAAHPQDASTTGSVRQPRKRRAVEDYHRLCSAVRHCHWSA
ncbi:MAG: hypothetical protein AAF830_13675 [Pseudomonadota bacterium]